ncbi:pentapeptide repeat-containing protein [Nostoc sp. FACHB-110]|uniref:pentapeptide repeat-containing protein n=1 Tax=Nostoc sp. FACHB-110 TaxID=2692834 RepID=UPI0016831B8F|nr:pentapeptide repeat-containing protein [Nostoc sp. FACHB-110]MBD2441431.1 pentapeptide repeat-containing protein [Nostoc sp. FACHB-110]
MNLSIRQWLAERHIEISQIREFTLGQLAGIAYRIVQDMEVKSLAPLDICTLAEVLELSLGSVWQDITIIARLTESLLRSLSEKKALKRNEGTWLTFQIAYLHALQQILAQEVSLQRPWLNRAIIPNPVPVLKELASISLQDVQLQGLLKTLSPGKLTDTQAEQALSVVADSLLVQQMNHATVAWLVANGAEDLEAKLLTQRLSHSLTGYLLKVIAENAPPLAQLQKFFQLGTASNISPPDAKVGTSTHPNVGDKIYLHRENYRASLLQNLSTPLFIESFALKDIYVPIKGLPVAANNTNAVDVRKWVEEQLENLETITVIESEPGYGKTSFCQIWAAQVARELYPKWMPVIIRLRDIQYGQTLAETLNSGFGFNSQINLANWLEQEHPQYVLILDGLDELPPSSLGTRAKVIFLQQLIKFQAQGKHKIILTSRKNTLESIDLDLSEQLQKIIIQPLDQEQLKQWFQQWAMLLSLPIAQNFFNFLKQSGLFVSKPQFPELGALVRQPLMLYLLGVLHRDALLEDEIWQAGQTNTATLVWEMYDRLHRWLLGYPAIGGIKTMLMRSGSAHIHRTQEAIANLLSNRHPQDILNQMQAIALQILHSDRSQIPLLENFPVNTLPAFYFKTVESKLLTEFSHPKLGQYLCATAIVNQLQTLTQQQENDYGTLNFRLDSLSSVAQHLYNLLGYGVLNQDTESLIIESLRHKPKNDFSLALLLTRLELFWCGYCQGRWLDEGIAHQAWQYFHTLKNPLTVEQINTYVGINIFILLSACYRLEKISFAPCGNPQNLTEFYPEALLSLIGRTAILSNHLLKKRVFWQSLAGINLAKASLLQVSLPEANLERTNFSDANLTGANLAGANLTGANLTGANLTGANLTGANLTNANFASANLSGANLTNVNLETVNFTNACLFNASLTDSNREIATLQGALFSLEQFHTLKKLLLQPSLINPVSTADKTEPWLINRPDIKMVESPEGETISAMNLYDDDAEDETVFGVNPSDYD